ncbi:hypothetical protein ACWDBO_31670 [Streptomyces mirabilis]|uniref:hypothetical protein n=1 Tax=Streptomyces mirabilis TaxID=68239 RepID=UPI0033272316
MDYLAITGAVAAGLSAVAAVGSWKAAHRANKTSVQAQETGERAFQTAEAVARIERDRRHEERRPQFELRLEPRSEQHCMLNAHLLGPDELGEVEIVSIRVDDDDKNRAQLTPGGPTREEVDNHVWGPLRFTPRVDEADTHGRGVGPFTLKVGRGRLFQMEPTPPGRWMTGTSQEQWQWEYRDHPVRLIITCRVGDEEWLLPRRLDLPDTLRRPPSAGR